MPTSGSGSTSSPACWRLLDGGRDNRHIKLQDAYLSVVEALAHAGGAHGLKVELDWSTPSSASPGLHGGEALGVDGVLVLPGFGHRGAEGKIEAVRYARESGTLTSGSASGCR